MFSLPSTKINLHVIFLFVVDKDDEPIGDDISVRKMLYL